MSGWVLLPQPECGVPVSPLSLSFMTIIARNYVPAARVLARSLQKHHPGACLYVVTIDADLSPAFSDLGNVKTLSIDEIGLPDLNVMAIKYDVLEFCTSVKPFALQYLMDQAGVEALVYLDPDIMVLSPLSEMVEALETASVVLTPHMLDAVDDAKQPGEIEILKSGIYNLGFIALRCDATGRALLAWWSERLFDRCLNATKDGLFVDQRWIDLVPGLFDGVRILREPGYNVAYWNLHERCLTAEGETWLAQDRPVRFYHFSGYSPDDRLQLSRHQTRFEARDEPDLVRLLGQYAQALMAEGHLIYAGSLYRFARLPNGVQVTPPVRRGLRILIDRGLDYPDPLNEADAFCARLCQPVLSSDQGPLCPLEYGVEATDPALLRGRPEAASGKPHDSFILWCRSEAGIKLGLSGVVIRGTRGAVGDRELDHILDTIETQQALVNLPGMVVEEGVYQRLVYWAKAYGATKGEWSETGVKALEDLWPQLRQVFNQCIYEPAALEVMKEAGWATRERLEIWLMAIFDAHDFSPHAVRLFCSAFSQHPTWFADIALYAAPTDQVWPSIFDLCSAQGVLKHSHHLQRRAAKLMRSGLSVATQFEIWRSNQSRQTPAGRMRSDQGLEASLKWMSVDQASQAQALAACAPSLDAHQGRLNLAGHFLAPTGMGEMARALLRTARAAGLEVSPVTLSTPNDDGPTQAFPFVFGVPLPQAAFSITAVNAETVNRAIDRLPHHYWAQRNIGLWLWETDRLPRRHGVTATAFDEIWTTSRSCRDAIAASVDVPVRVLPLALDLEALEGAKPNRQAFGLPEKALLFGYMFDFDSVLERKNPMALIRAFKAAFGDDPNVCLVLKTLGRPPHDYAARQVFEAGRQSNIRFISGTLSRSESLDLMATLDVYVSLHRYEGFGLTCAEAMALGKPVIATDYSGNQDFMDADCALMVPAKVQPTPRAYGPYARGAKWAVPDEAVVVDMMRSLLSAERREDIGQKGRARILSQLSPEVVAAQLKTLLEAG